MFRLIMVQISLKHPVKHKGFYPSVVFKGRVVNWVMGYGLWVMGYGLWVMGYGLWVMGKQKEFF
tara:strand:+ start:23931 stop:24122 length:192 start_codon:yes stop_codon:yes gene_type:complete